MITAVVMIITACTFSGACREYPFVLSDEVTMKMCEQQGQIGLAEWAGEHPALTIRRWRCEAAAKRAA